MRHKVDKDAQALAAELQALPVFAGIPTDVLEDAASLARVVHLPPGWAMVTQGQPADSCYVLLEGTTEVRSQGEAVTTLGPGALIGESALIEGRTRTASVITTTAVRAVRFGYEDVLALFAKHQELEQAVLAEYRRKATA